MDQFFEQQRAEGATDSSGAFTVSPEQARKKLKLFQLAEPDSCLLKVVQAAVAAGAEEIELLAGRRELQLTFHCSDETLLEPVRLASALLEVHSLPDGPLRHLTVALNAASACSLKEVRWETPRGQLRLTKDLLKCEPEKRYERHRLTLVKKRRLLDWFRGSLFTSEVRHLTKRCPYARAAITIDGRPIDRPDIDRLGQHLEDDLGLEKPFYLLERQVPGDKLWIALPKGDDYTEVEGYLLFTGSSWRRTPAPLLIHGSGPGDSPRAVEMLVGIQPSWNGEGTVIFVKDGVSLPPVTADLGHPRAAVVCDAAGLTLDLSEFSVVEDEALKRKLTEIRTVVRETALQLSEGPLEQALQAGEISESFRPGMVTRLKHWLKEGQLGKPGSFKELLEQCLPHQPPFYLSPLIPLAKEDTFRRLHDEHLPDSEELLALFDDNILGGAKTGFGITESRLCWRDTLDVCGVLLWQDLLLDDLEVKDGKVHLMGAEIPCIMKKEVAPRLLDFLSRVKDLAFPEVLDRKPHWARIFRRAFQTVGLRSHIYYHPHIPPIKLKEIKDALGINLRGQQPLVFYDDTLFGKSTAGLVVTQDLLVYRNAFGESMSYNWLHLKKQPFQATDSGVKFGDEQITVCRAALREPLARFLEALRS